MNASDLAARYAASFPAVPGNGPADLVASLLAARGPSVVGELNGVFSLISQHSPTGRVLVANDRHGFCPLFFHAGDGLLLVASECRAIRAVVTSLTPDYGGWGDIFYAGGSIGDRTLYSEVKALGPGEYLLWEQGREDRKRYWSFGDVATRSAAEVSVDDVHRLFVSAVERRLDRDREDVLLLSAGLDSRLILGAMLECGCRPHILTVDFEEPHGLARSLADRFGLACTERPERPGLLEFLDAFDAFYMIDGLRPTNRFRSPGVKVSPWLEPGPAAAWDGFLVGRLVSDHVLSRGSPRQNAWRYLKNRPMHRPLLKRILNADVFEQMGKEFLREFDAALDAVSADEEGGLRFGLRHHCARSIARQTHDLHARKLRAITPADDNDFLDYMISVPYARRRHGRLLLELFDRCYPEMLDTPFVTYGQRLHNMPGRARTRDIKHTAVAHVHLVKRAGLGPAAMALAMRRRGNVRSKEIAFMCRVVRMKSHERGIYQQNYVERVLAGAERGNLRWWPALHLVYTIELWHLMFEEGQYGALRQDLLVSAEEGDRKRELGGGQPTGGIRT